MSVTLISIFRRRPGMTHEEFVDYYENSHALIGNKVLAGYATDYRRRFIRNAFEDKDDGNDQDVVMEITFPSKEKMDEFYEYAMGTPEIRDMIIEDEEKIFDRPRMKGYILEREEVSDLPPVK